MCCGTAKVFEQVCITCLFLSFKVTINEFVYYISRILVLSSITYFENFIQRKKLFAWYSHVDTIKWYQLEVINSVAGSFGKCMFT